jgi:hypothetical protein
VVGNPGSGRLGVPVSLISAVSPFISNVVPNSLDASARRWRTLALIGRHIKPKSWIGLIFDRALRLTGGKS